ncbi:CO dehydrogenase/acetyl-CoA synthase delta subunit, TIM barrel [Thermodesulfobacterium geofontis OPF15]|jgi:acetyl-CoA decarbonylase/synthase complex subunit delta|uniref:CO dehydrogenase/acetyl-CoA synthase delta subunit, TIM barrel n=1 Tax=Thermodesulfobacterium geofontis (strain OPF15) TaxID=795359 RepID=F8C3P8_THEGP|nr:acetyl-CoA decarbonylase/synthase complex subunit delta [Thermodesulfobacterium geofontis]AEH22499.1 CO dehydrogenase/acetyl-CoA synthase delta subunit, TIM barrel [Thermodesulfobacterium geofontis OPF15]
MQNEKELLKILIDILSDLKSSLKSISEGIKNLEEGIEKLETEIFSKKLLIIEKKEEEKPLIVKPEKVKIEVPKIEIKTKYRPLSERAKNIPENLYKDISTEKIREVVIGKGEKAIKIGGENILPFYFFEGSMGNEIKIAMEILDVKPEEWPQSLAKYFSDVFHDPALWAKKCVEVYKAEAICLYLQGTDPNYLDLDVNHAKEVVKKVRDAIEVPLIIWGSGNSEKDVEILKEVAELIGERGAVIGPVLDTNYRTLGAIAMGYNLPIIASTPIDVNLAKQLNILLENMGVPLDKIIIDPSIGALGYGIEYAYSVMERIRIAALYYKDTALQSPFVCAIGREVWGTKEVQLPTDEIFGDQEGRGILMEAITAVVLALAGGNLLIMRHPKAIELCKSFFNILSMS